jgi:hypothetical protein
LITRTIPLSFGQLLVNIFDSSAPLPPTDQVFPDLAFKGAKAESDMVKSSQYLGQTNSDSEQSLPSVRFPKDFYKAPQYSRTPVKLVIALCSLSAMKYVQCRWNLQ